MADIQSRNSSETDNFETSSLHAAIFAAGDRIAQSRPRSPPPPLPPLPSNSTGRSTATSPPSTANTITTSPSSIFSVPIQSTSDLTPILTNLYISSLGGAGNALELSRHNITHILSVTTAKPFLTFPEAGPARPQIQHHHIQLTDDPSAPLLELLPEITKWIYHALQAPDAIVLVHCEFGVSRAPSAVIGYIMAVQDVSFREALRMVKEKRRTASPNTGFVRGLSKWAAVKADWWEDGRPKERSARNGLLDGAATTVTGGSEREVDVGSEGSTLEGTAPVEVGGGSDAHRNIKNPRLERQESSMELKAKVAATAAAEKREKKGWRGALKKMRCW